jgi:hypothetical protein
MFNYTSSKRVSRRIEQRSLFFYYYILVAYGNFFIETIARMTHRRKKTHRAEAQCAMEFGSNRMARVESWQKRMPPRVDMKNACSALSRIVEKRPIVTCGA